jgi:membrane associated rhomboid family serine protease
MSEEKTKFLLSLSYPAGFLTIIWLIKIIEVTFGFSFVRFGLLPHHFSGLIGIITYPLIHANFNHLISNSIPLLFLGAGLFYFYPNAAVKLFILIYFLPGILIWFFARPAYHIGASGLIYGLVTFFFFSGIIRRDNRSIALALIVTFLYGSLVWGILPIDPAISWEGHLFGSLTGILCAFIFRRYDPPKKYDWENEPDDDDDGKIEISYNRKSK